MFFFEDMFLGGGNYKTKTLTLQCCNVEVLKASGVKRVRKTVKPKVGAGCFVHEAGSTLQSLQKCMRDTILLTCLCTCRRTCIHRVHGDM